MWNKIQVDSKSTYTFIPTSLNTINLRLGMNLASVTRIKKKADKPMMVIRNIIVKRDDFNSFYISQFNSLI